MPNKILNNLTIIIFLISVLLSKILLNNCSFAQETNLVIQTGHTNTIRLMTFSPDNTLLASCDGDKIILWDVTSGKELRYFIGHYNHITSIAFSPDGKYLASGSFDGSIILWDIYSGKKINIYEQGSSIYDISFSPDGKTIVAGGTNLYIWDVNSNKILTKILENNLITHHISFSQDGNLIAFSTEGNGEPGIHFWNLNSRKEIKKIIDKTKFDNMSFSPDGKLFYYTNCGKINILETNNYKEIFSNLIGGKAHFTSNSKNLIYERPWGKILINELESGFELKEFPFDTWYFNSFTVSHDDKYLAVSLCGKNDEEKDIILLNIETGNVIHRFVHNSNGISDLSVSFYNKSISIACIYNYNKMLRFINLEDKINSLTYLNDSYMSSIAFSKNENQLYFTCYDGNIKFWDIASRKVKNFFGENIKKTILNAISINSSLLFSPNYDILAVKGGTNVYLLDVNKDKLIKTLKGDDDLGLESISFSSNGKLLVGGGCVSNTSNYNEEKQNNKKGRIVVWNIESGKIISRIYCYDEIYKVKFLNNSDDVLSGGTGDFSITLWENAILPYYVKFGKTFYGHHHIIDSFELTSDDKYLISGSYDNTSILWDVKNGEKIYVSNIIGNHIVTLKNNLLISENRDEIIFSDIHLNKLLCKLYLLDKNDWAVISPDGYFDVSSNGMNFINLVQGLKILPLDANHNNFYKPNLLLKILHDYIN